MSDKRAVFANLHSKPTLRDFRVVGLLVLWAWAGAPSCSTGKFGRLRVECPQPQAAVFVDGKYLGAVRVLADSDIRLPAGPHRVEIRQRGFYARYRSIRIEPGGLALLRIHLVPRLDWALVSPRKPTGRPQRTSKP